MKIAVDYYPSEYAVTVQGGYYEDDYFVMEWCNHANADYVDKWYKDYDRSGDPTIDYLTVMSCDRCDEVLDEEIDEDY